MPYTRDVTFNAQQQEAFAQLVRDKLSQLGWTRAQAAEKAGVLSDKVSVLAKTAPTGMPYGYFLKVLLALDIDLYQAVQILGLDTDVRELMNDPATAHQFPNAHRHLGGGDLGIDPLTALVQTLPPEKQDSTRRMISAILANM